MGISRSTSTSPMSRSVKEVKDMTAILIFFALSDHFAAQHNVRLTFCCQLTNFTTLLQVADHCTFCSCQL